MRIERQLQGTLNTVFTELIKEQSLEKKILAYPAQEEHRADITIKNSDGIPLFFIELKDPTAKDGKSVFDNNVLIREVERAQKHGIKYFGNCNFLACAFIQADKVYEKSSVNEGFFTIYDIYRLSKSYTPNKEIEKKLRSIAQFYLDRALEILERKEIKFNPLDELYIFKIRKLIEAYAYPISDKVWQKYSSDRNFSSRINKYAQSQLWNKPTTFEEVENLTHIAILMLISKLIFYKAYVDNRTWHQLSPMQIDENINSSEELESIIWKYFDEFKEITNDFELLIGEKSDIIFHIPFVSDGVIALIKEVLNTSGHYDFSKIAYDVIGRIFEELIREDERHKLGQYFTPPHVIDLINSYCIIDEMDKVFDPSCGSGTFLVRAYERKKEISRLKGGIKPHDILLSEIYGNDLSGYPVYLSMLNLAIRNTKKASYPLITNKDFFSITENFKVELHNQHGILEKKKLPKFDAIIGNPPYTRQEDIGIMKGTVSKTKIQSMLQRESGIIPSQRTSIYGYFFYHATTFLKEKGFIGYVCQNSWLETDYGNDLQKYFLNNFKIVAIMDSEVERFFPTASVNTTIVILQREKIENQRNDNIVRFVYFKNLLLNIIKQNKTADDLKKFIQANTAFESKELRINSVNQSMLKKQTKWTQFLKAPKIYFDLQKKASFKTLLDFSEKIRFGIKTGNNDFFILKDITNNSKSSKLKLALNRTENIDSFIEIENQKLRLVENGKKEIWLIERDLLHPLLTSPKDVSSYKIDNSNIQYFLFSCAIQRSKLQDSYPYASQYVLYGERMNVHLTPTVSSRNIWYFLGEREIPDLSFSYMINDVGKTFIFNGLTNNNFHNIYIKKELKTISLYLNSTISWMIQQLIMRSNLGDGAGKIEKYELENFPVPQINLNDINIDLGSTRSYKEELGDLKNLKTANPERLKLDRAILVKLGYKENELNDLLIDLYQNTYRLIDARLKKAQSQKGVKSQRNKVEIKVYVDLLKRLLQENNIKASNSLRFAKEIEKLVLEITSETNLQKRILTTYWKEKYGKVFNSKEIAQQAQGKLF